MGKFYDRASGRRVSYTQPSLSLYPHGCMWRGCQEPFQAPTVLVFLLFWESHGHLSADCHADEGELVLVEVRTDEMAEEGETLPPIK